MGASEMLGFKGPPGDWPEDRALERFMESDELAAARKRVADATEVDELWQAVNELSELVGEFTTQPSLWIRKGGEHGRGN